MAKLPSCLGSALGAARFLESSAPWRPSFPNRVWQRPPDLQQGCALCGRLPKDVGGKPQEDLVSLGSPRAGKTFCRYCHCFLRNNQPSNPLYLIKEDSSLLLL